MLYVVATPIGNLEDMTLRAISTLKSVDFVLCEDTRVTHKLLKHFDIDTPTISFHEYSEDSKYEKILQLLSDEKELALVTDAGTPGISDPGSFLVQTIREKMPDVKIAAVPGASAIAATISISGLNMKEFTFLGFPPHKKGRKTFFENVVRESGVRPVMFYESRHRLIKALEVLEQAIPEKNIIIAKELTKMFEEIISGTPQEILQVFSENHDKIKGEFVVIVS
jgi:16S rRNA (cytidine1402-2'-O)-methyltransferase